MLSDCVPKVWLKNTFLLLPQSKVGRICLIENFQYIDLRFKQALDLLVFEDVYANLTAILPRGTRTIEVLSFTQKLFIT